MILDRLSNCEVYRRLGENFSAGFDFLLGDLSSADGRYAIRGDDVFGLVQSYQTKPVAQGRWEAHRAYADIQYVVAGCERMGVAALEGMTTQTAYDAARDLEFFSGEGQFVLVERGSFAIFLPRDVHMPTIAVDEVCALVKKVVVKVRV